MDAFLQQSLVSVTGRMFVLLRFGVVIHLSGQKAQWDSLANFAAQAEALGYDSVWVSDHLMSPTGSPRAFEAWTTMSALSQLTSRMRLGTYVLCNQFRHPSMLAKMAATLDNISEGRLDLGLGAGWFIGEHLTFGFEWYTHFNRIKRLGETLEVVKRLWTADNVTWSGKYVHLRRATLEPKPVQKPHPPIWIGGGSPSILKTVARSGDGWIPVLPSPKQLKEGIASIKREMIESKRDPKKLQVAYGGSGCLIISEDRNEVKEMSRHLLRSTNRISNISNCIIGTPDQCISKVEEYRRAGANMIVAGFYDFPSLKGLRLFAEKVIPRFKSLPSYAT